MPFSKTSRCSGSTTPDCTMCRSWTFAGSTIGERSGKQIRLLLVVALQADPVARPKHRLEEVAQLRDCNSLAASVTRPGLNTGFPVRFLSMPLFHCASPRC